jgi:branched-chain amino acid transport system substrate-binding protein
MKRTSWRVLPLIAAVALLLTACPADDETAVAPDDDVDAPDNGVAAPEGDPLKIGMATTLSGAIALFGVANENAAQLAVEELNEAGGVLGRPVELIVRDDEARPEEGVAHMRDFILTEEVDVVLGPVSSGVALAQTELALEHQIPFIVHTSNTEALTVTNWHEYLISVVPNTGMEARAQGVDLAQSEYTQWATIAPDYEFGRIQTGTFVETMQADNPDVDIVEQQWPELGEADFQPFITSLMGTGAEAIYSPLFAGDLITFSRQADDLGFFDRVYFTALYETDALAELGDEVDLEGVRAYSRCPFTIDTPQMADFVDRYTERYGNVPSDWACMAYDAVHLWAQLVEAAGSADADAVIAQVPGFEFTSLRGDTYIREIDHQAAVASYITELTYSEEHGMYIYETYNEVPAEEIWLSEDEILERCG